MSFISFVLFCIRQTVRCAYDVKNCAFFDGFPKSKQTAEEEKKDHTYKSSCCISCPPILDFKLTSEASSKNAKPKTKSNFAFTFFFYFLFPSIDSGSNCTSIRTQDQKKKLEFNCCPTRCFFGSQKRARVHRLISHITKIISCSC